MSDEAERITGVWISPDRDFLTFRIGQGRFREIHLDVVAPDDPFTVEFADGLYPDAVVLLDEHAEEVKNMTDVSAEVRERTRQANFGIRPAPAGPTPAQRADRVWKGIDRRRADRNAK